MPPVEFTNVLYVPSLHTNLFSILYLAMNRHFFISIWKDTISFIRNGHIAFKAKVTASNSAFLVGESIPTEEFAGLSSTATLALDWTLL
ncbi:hypothetical protein B0F90DRAFT_1660892 [Multifurca ochricompacta]|uniref:Uncharacterized protein n=1 Tax=Multifurca ochricompacta TaxID=376703 RepID=A0AAD4LW09_9AGAM|nr:hypothetical protein B0F90DRAFT_1660892 [Multifurca ochricompacta]